MLNSLTRRPLLAAVAVFLLVASVAAALIWRMDRYERQEKRVRALSLAGEHAYSLQRGIAHNLSAAYALAALVRQGRGAVLNFDEVAREMLPYYPGVSELALAPDGVIRRVAPLAGNEKAIGHDLLRDPAQKKEALLARDSGKLTLAGPLELVQGGPAVVGRLPVILEDRKERPYFWGFAMTVMRFPQALEAVNLSRLAEQGFAYQLWRMHPDGGQKQIIAASSNTALADAVEHSLQVPNATWTLSLMPLAGWGSPVRLALEAALGLLFSLLLAYLAKLLLELRMHRAGLEALVAQRTAELHKSESHYRELFEASPQPMWVYDLETLKFLAVNEAAVARYGYSRGEFEAMSILDIRPHEDVPRLLQRIAEVRKADNGASGIWRHRRKNGTLIDVEISSSMFVFGARRAQLVLASDITDRLRAERKLSESEARFRSLTEMASDWYWESDAEHRLTLLSAGAGDGVAQLPQGSPLGKRRWEMAYRTPDEAGWEAHRAALDARRPFRDFEFSRLGADGVERYTVISGDPVFDASGGFIGYRGVGKYCTERKVAEAKIARLSQLYAALGQCNQAIVRCASEEELFPQICRDAVQFGGMKSARISLIDPDTRRVRVAASFGYGNDEVQDVEVSADADSPYGHGPTGTAIRENRPYWGQDFMNDPATAPWRERGARLGWGAVAALPLYRNGAVIGVFIVFEGEANAFDQARRELLLEMAGDISFAMDNFEREARRRQAEQALRESEARFRSLTEMSSDFYWETDAEHRLTQRSSGSGRNALLALTHDDWHGRCRWEIPYLAPGESGWQAHRAVLDAHLPVRDFEFVRAGVDGGARHMLINGDPVFDASGAFRGYRGVGTDITGRKAAERALAESEARFRSLTEMSSDFYWASDAEHRLTARDSANKRLSMISSFQRGAQIGERRWEIPYLSPDAAGWEAHRALLEAHLPFRNFELSRPGVDGAERFISISGDPVFDASGVFTGYRGVGTDITERKHEERLLRLEHAVARSLAEAGDESSALITVMRSVCETNNWGRGTYWRLDEAAGVMRFGEHWNMPGAEFEHYTEGSRAVVFERGVGMVGRVWQSGEPLWVADFYDDPRVVQKTLAREAGMRSVLVLPVMAAGSTFGVLAFFSRVAREPDARLLATTRMIGSAVGQFLQRMQAEAQVSRINAELEARVASRTRELEIAVSELEAFSYSVSHDLRAPLRAIHGFSSLLREQYASRIDEQGRDMLGRVSAGAEKMGQLIDDLLKLSRVSRQEMKIEPVDLSEMAWEVIGELQAELPERRVEWVIAPQVLAMGDAGLLRVVLQNLIGNAWKYSSRREHARVEFGMIERDGRLAYFVRDNGAGFDMAQVKKLFGAFQRLHSTAEFPGSGIGLATVSRVIHRHGGDVWGEGRVGEGATFHFSLG